MNGNANSPVVCRRDFWVLGYVAVALATLAGLFAMHGLPMTMPAAGAAATASRAGAMSIGQIPPKS